MPHINRTVYMPLDLLQAFSEHTGLFWSGVEIEGAICDAIAAAMEPKPAPAHQLPAEAAIAGYQWKQVFLPDGTLLRASFGRKPIYAVVEGTDIKFGEYSLSPSAFANLYGSGNRNAWKAVWLRFPGTPDWVRADACREVRLAATVKMYEPAPPVADPDHPPAPPAGPYQQQYTDEKPTRNDAVPLYQLLANEGEVENEDAVPDPLR